MLRESARDDGPLGKLESGSDLVGPAVSRVGPIPWLEPVSSMEPVSKSVPDAGPRSLSGPEPETLPSAERQVALVFARPAGDHLYRRRQQHFAQQFLLVQLLGTVGLSINRNSLR